GPRGRIATERRRAGRGPRRPGLHRHWRISDRKATGFSMPRMPRPWRRLAMLGAALPLVWIALVQIHAWRARAEVRRAQQEIMRGRLDLARPRLGALAAEPGVLGGAGRSGLGGG